MKKVFTVILLFTFLFCGCSKKATSERTLPMCFTADAEIEFDGMTYRTLLTRMADGWWEVELTAPEAVKGLIFAVNGEDTEISFKGLHFTFDTSKFPVGSVVSLAIRSFDKIAPLELDIIEGETTDFSSGEANGTVYTMTLDKNGTPLTLELGDCGMKITFLSFEEIDESQTGVPEIIISPDDPASKSKTDGGAVQQ